MNSVPFPPVNFPDPEIHPAERSFPILLRSSGRVVDGYLRRRNSQHPYAYERYDKCIDLGYKGKIIYGRIHQRCSSSNSNSGRYEETEEFVVIKKLSKSYIRNRGGMHDATENPRVEIAASQMIGDNVHVVGLYDALEDQRYLYLVMPYLGTDLFDAVQAASNQDAMNDNDDDESNNAPDAPTILQTLCRNLLYLQHHNIIHRDFSPENVIVHSIHAEACCPLIDLAMALQCATLEQQVLPIVPQETACGKLPYMSPEVAQGNSSLDFGVDVYALGGTLFFLWTGGTLLYEQPGDRCFNFFVRDNGIRDAPRLVVDDDTTTMDMWLSMHELPTDWHPVLEKLLLVQALSDNQRDLLANMLHMDPAERLTVPEILQHAYLQEQTAAEEQEPRR